jgi:putative membrane protein
VSEATPPPRGPRVIVEEAAAPAPRLDFEWEQAVVPVAPAPALPAPRWGGQGRALTGAAIIAGGLAALSIANFVTDQFARGPAQGWLSLGVIGLGGALLLGGAWRELRGLWSIRHSEAARAAFARADLPRAKAEALRWAASVAPAATVQPAIRNAVSIEELRALLEPAQAQLATEAAALGRQAALQAFAMTAVSPSAGLDVGIFAWRGVRLVRQVAALFGLRPGFVGTVALLRRTLYDAATVGATDIAVDAAARAVLSNPILQHVAGEAASGAVAARRMLRLAAVTAEACRITPRAG